MLKFTLKFKFIAHMKSMQNIEINHRNTEMHA